MLKTMLSAFVFFICVASFASFKTVTHDMRNSETWITIKADLNGKNRAVDILFVIDDSGSMTTHQKNLADQAPLIANELSFYTSIQTAVITTTMQSGPRVGGRFVGPVLTASNPNFASALTQQLIVGVTGNGVEKPFDTVLAATSEPLISSTNAGFIRPHADLILVFLTDTEDQSLNTNSTELLNHLRLLKPNTDIFTVLITSDFETGCDGESYVTNPLGLKTLVEETNGQMISLCEPFAVELPKTFSNIKNTMNIYKLDSLPNTQVEFKSVNVLVDGTPLPIGDLVQGWVYNINTSQVIVAENIIYNSNYSLLEITYKLVPLK